MEFARFAELCDQVAGHQLSAADAALALGKPAAPAGGARSYRHGEAYLRDHLVQDRQVLIGVTYASLAIDHYLACHAGADGVCLQGLDFLKPVVVEAGETATMCVESRPRGAEQGFELVRVGASSRETVARGRLQAGSLGAESRDVGALRSSMVRDDALGALYPTEGYLRLGPSFRTVTELYRHGQRALARVVLTPEAAEHAYALHPLFINSAFLSLAPLAAQMGVADAFLPFGIRELQARREAGLRSGWVLVELKKRTEELLLFDFEALDDQGTVVARAEGCALKRIRTVAAAARTAPPAPVDRGTVVRYLVERVARVAGCAPGDIDLGRNIMDMGLGSQQVVDLGAEIQAELKIELSPTLFFEYTNIEELAAHLLQVHAQAFSALQAPQRAVPAPAPALAATAVPAAPLSAPAAPTVPAHEPIAIIGMQGQFARSDDLETFWSHLVNETELMREVPPDHWDYRPWFDAEGQDPDKTYCKWGSFIEEVDKFDAGFFNISRREAEWIDPQIRMLLQSVHATAEDAGYAGRLRGTNTGVFVGACFHDYQYKIDELRLPVNPYLGVNNTHTVLANRISYHFNLSGPSVTVDTACSSSLVALHQACQALQRGECDVALVCGANLLLSSIHYRVFSSLKALSPTGRCHTFDAAADGYVPGECVASMMLKPLSRALRDGDRIEAVIRGSAALHGGYTPSLTAPSVSGEQNVILKAWDDARIDPATLGYVEAHGTGTRLGDPIEINALKAAFAARTDRQQFCSVGSVKSNIGHTEGAAGIAGVLKVILQMKHRRIPPLMGFRQLNPYISLDGSALRLDAGGAAWDSPPGVPRRAGVSSFGVAGAYAHVVVEEFLDAEPPVRPAATGGPVAIVLSARNEASLLEQARRLLAHVQQGRLAPEELDDAAYTLQLGRQAMEWRLGLVVASVPALESALQAFVLGRPVDGLRKGCARRGADAAAAAPEARRQAGDWIAQGALEPLLDLWVNGAEVDWAALHKGRRPRWLKLPTYAFRKDSYWLPEAEIAKAAAATAVATVARRLHPLLHENDSRLQQQAYASRFSGEEFFLADHRVRGRKLLPGVAHLEMLRAALAHATGGGTSALPALALHDVRWLRPAMAGREGLELRVSLREGEGGVLHAEVHGPASADGERALFSRAAARPAPPAALQPLDLQALGRRCCRRRVDREAAYAVIDELGLDLGPSLRGIQAIDLGDDCLLAELALPAAVSDAPGSFVLHPSLMDASLQACASLLLERAGGRRQLALPYALEGLELLAPVTASRMWAFVEMSQAAAADPLCVDIQLCDEAGRVCVRMTGLAFRLAALPEGTTAGASGGSGVAPLPAIAATEAEPPVLLAVREWAEPAAPGVAPPAVRYASRDMLFCDLDPHQVEALVQACQPTRHERLDSRHLPLAERFELLVRRTLEAIQAMAARGGPGPSLLQVILLNAADSPMQHALVPLLKTAQLEDPRFMGQLLELDGSAGPAAWAAQVHESAASFDHQVSYRQGRRRVMATREIEPRPLPAAHAWRDGGVYLLTGGGGGLGLLLAREIAARSRAPRLILAGRAEASATVRAALDELAAQGAQASYRRLDVTDAAAVSDTVAAIVREHGALHGIVHAAGVLGDELIRRRRAADIATTMAPKVRGTVNLDAASKDLPLDLFLLFSSIAGVFGNAGQADYACANAFMDMFAQRRAEMARLKLRSGRTLSVNWPLWREGRMRPPEATLRLLSATLGLEPIGTRAAFDALYRALAGEAAQKVVLAGDVARLRARLLPPMLPGFAMPAPATDAAPAPAAQASPAHATTSPEDAQALLDRVVRLLTQRAATILKMPAAEIDVKADIDTFGFNSVALTDYVNALNAEFKLALTPTVFYEHSSLARFAQHLVSTHPGHFVRPGAAPARPQAGPLPPVAAAPATRPEPPAAPVQAPPAGAPATEAHGAIAIIGLSGSFPMAADLRDFWQNLEQGRDCISEIPPDRWDWQALWGDPQQAGDRSNVKWGGFIDGVAAFDPLFFGISPREAACMDPQQRLLMTHAWRTLEDAGYSAQSLSGSDTAVFVATTATGYGDVVRRSGTGVEAYMATGLVPSVGPNRMSYFLNWHGPSEPIETACSSALVAVHRGVQALRAGECRLALVGGVNTIFSPELHISFNRAGMLSEDGRCKAFSARANGFARGEGVGLMLLKDLQAAERDGDHIYGVIRGTAQNHGGRSKSLTAPNPAAQAELLRRAYADAGIDPATVGYVETHGTGTPLGDPIEVEGLKLAFGAAHAAAPGRPAGCGLGSVKSNIGHLELAAGVAGIFKVLLQFRHKTLVSSLHCEALNPYLALEGSPFFVVRENMPWPAGRAADGSELPRRAGVSSFGFGGTNCHVVLEEYVPGAEATAPAAPLRPAAIVLSARSAEQLRERARQLLDHLRSAPDGAIDLDDLAYTLQVGREPMEHRLALLSDSVDELVTRLQEHLEQGRTEDLFEGRVDRRNAWIDLFAEDADLQTAVQQWVRQRRVSRLLGLWVQGMPLDWSLLHGGARRRRLALPTYPFSREAHWPGAAAPTALPAPAAPPLQEHVAQPTAGPGPALRYLEKAWSPVEPPRRAQAGPRDGTLAILAGAATRQLAQALSRHFDRSEVVDVAEAMARHESGGPSWEAYHGCIDLVGCAAPDEDVAATLQFVQGLVEHGRRDGLTLLGVTRGLEAEGRPAADAAGAMRAALYRMLQAEYPQLRARHVDLDPAGDEETVCRLLAQEYACQGEGTEVRYQGSLRLEAGLQESPRWSAGAEQPLELPADGVLWITGGTRGLGLRVAQHFVSRHGVRRLVLSGREAMPPREQWAAHELQNTPMGRKVRALLDLEDQGVSLLALAVELDDPAAVQAAVAQAKQSLGPIVGVVHGAGIVGMDNPAFIRKSASEMRSVLQPKLAGTRVLFDSLAAEPLRFFVMFSSVSALIPRLGAGVADYAMANACLDQFARSRKASFPVISIQWPRWSESGMRGGVSRAYQELGLQSLGDEEGLAILDAVLARRAGAVVMPLKVDPLAWKPAALMRSSAPDAVRPSAPAATAAVPASRPATGGAASDGAAALLQWLTQFFSRELKIPAHALKPDVPFQDYGMESVMLAQVVGRMEREFEGLTVDPSIILENPTIGQLASHLAARHPALVAQLMPRAESQPPAPATQQAMPPVPSPQRPPAEAARPAAAKEVARAPRTGRVAVVGMAAHLPDAADTQAFWDNLLAGRDSIREVPASRWDTAQHYSAEKGARNKSISRWGAFIDCIEDFDPGYFGIPDSLAVQMDPLERQWLEVSAEALADAGYGRRGLWGRRVGVFVGARSSNYRDKLSDIDKDVVVGLGQNFIAAHLAHIYNFKGPNLVVDAACASSLTAVHLAVESLRRGESEVALAGGVEVLLDESPYVVLSTAQVLSPDGRCRTFDEKANGIGLGEGCAVLVLKPFEKALADGDKIYGVIDGSAINNDGHTMGITTPNPAAQSELIEDALASAGVDRASISYVETHGTGTLIGDPIELNALTKVFAGAGASAPFCGVGSVKSNLGHLLSAAGAAGLVKVLLAMVHRQLPPSIHCEHPNPRFNFRQSPLHLVDRAQAWPGIGGVLRAGVSSFGLGGNNAHVIVSDEGVPAHLRADLVPRGEPVRFQRRRLWPDTPRRQEPAARAATPASTAADPQMLDFFDVLELERHEGAFA